jgi:hypothetical protein
VFADSNVNGPVPAFVNAALNPPAKTPLTVTGLSNVKVVAALSVPDPLNVNAPFRGTVESPKVNAPANV